VKEVESEIHVPTNDCNHINNSEQKMPTQPNTLKQNQQMHTQPITSKDVNKNTETVGCCDEAQP